MAHSLDDVIRQMAQYDIDVPARVDLAKAFKGYLRWRPSSETKSKKTAWARLFEYRSEKTSRIYITGKFGVRGDAWEVEATPTDWSPAERAEWLEQRKEAERAAEAARAKDAESAAEKAARMWAKGRDEGTTPYLERKNVGAFGVRILFGKQVAVPLRDMQGTLHGLQYIYPEKVDGVDKRFGTGTIKEGRFHLIGEVQKGVPIAFGEGYATCATGHMATAWPVVTCFDAGNIEPVMAVWRKLYPDHEFVILADDDRHVVERLCERLARVGVTVAPEAFSKEKGGFRPMEWELPDGTAVHLKVGVGNDSNGCSRLEGSLTVGGQVQMLKLENAGKAKAIAAAKRHKATVLLPRFADRSSPFTDWNDLHLLEGLPACREQMLSSRESGGAAPGKKRANGRPQGGGAGEGSGQEGTGGEDQRFIDRYTLIYGTTTVWDAQTRKIVRIEALKAMNKRLTDWWLGRSDRKMVDEDRVVFDPTLQCKPPEWVNLFGGLPLEPDSTKGCARIVEHLYNLCQQNDRLFHWVASWLALPLQKPGAKMRTAIVLHGRTEGTGKSLMMDIMRLIYGRHGKSITQLQLQSEFTGWMSGMLFCVAEEVVSAADRKHHKGLLQNLVTNEVVQINEKNMPVRQERNFANFAFLSNDQIPMLLNPKDRRYMVFKCEMEHPEEYFQAIRAELDAGGAEAFYAWLLEYDVDGFNEFTRPLDTKDRLHLITLGMNPDQRFFHFWSKGHAGVPFTHCPARDLYTAFKAWCRVNGERFVANATAFGRTISEHLEALQAPPKRVVRYQGWSEKCIEDGDFKGIAGSTQGIVYFVPVAKPEDEGEPRPPGEPAAEASEDGKANVSKEVQRFQEQLHELVRSARRAL